LPEVTHATEMLSINHEDTFLTTPGKRGNMKTNTYVQSTRRNQSRAAVVSLYIFSAISLIGLYIGSSISVQAVTTYHDVWLAGDDEESQYIVGCAITDGDYDWEYHHTRAEATLVSTAGRTETQFSEDTEYPQQTGLYPYALAEAILTVDENDVGDYHFETLHTSTCPIANFASVNSILPVALFSQGYAYNGFDQLFQEHVYKVNCIGSCTASYPRQRRYNQYRGPFLGCVGISVNFFGRICAGRCRGSDLPVSCV